MFVSTAVRLQQWFSYSQATVMFQQLTILATDNTGSVLTPIRFHVYLIKHGGCTAVKSKLYQIFFK